MSGTFTGFSETDIKNVQSGFSVQKPMDSDKHVTFPPKSKKAVKLEIRYEGSKNAISVLKDTSDIPDEAKLYKPEVSIEPKPSSKNEALVEDTPETKLEETTTESSITTDVNKLETKAIDIKEFQTRQKLIEEQNRRRKEILIKALADKKKQTQEEARKLNEIQNQFKKLDAVLSNDVKLLRRRIEMASIDYMEAEKRYSKLEKEFLDAKLLLQQKSEKKELLTEHLARIIEQNEQRKAEKLTELLNKLEMSDIDENEEGDQEVSNK